jgi:hypothetical protein
MSKPNEARPSYVIAYHALQNALGTLQATKPNDRSDIDRRYAVTVTVLEQAVAYFNTFVVIPSQGDSKTED